MLYTFKSDAAADVLMFGDAAKKLVAILGKDAADPKGIVTVEQLPGAIARLRAAIEADRAQQTPPSEEQEARDREAGQTGMAAAVSLAQRAWPLLDMLEQSQRAGVPVVWGV